MLAIIGGAAAVGVAALLGYAGTRPGTFRIQRSTTIAAPPERIYALLDDFRKWSSWSPYEKLDPALKRDYSGAARGVGAAYAWEGNAKAGKGRMEIVEATPASRIAIDLRFERPFKARNLAEFTLAPTAGGTSVTWSMTGPSPFVSRLMGVVLNLDKLVGRDFESGLANIKALAEK